MSRLDSIVRGPHLRLPRPLDAVSDWWAGRPPRVRFLIGALLVLGALSAVDAQTRAVDARWGGDPVRVLIAPRDLLVGETLPTMRSVLLPPDVVPPGAVHEPAEDAVLALALPRGAVLTGAHVDERGPARGLTDGMRAVPLPTEEGWGVVAGGWVDVWTLGTGQEPSRLVASSRPVLEVRHDASGLTSLVGMTEAEVEAVTSGLALGRVLLAHAPAPVPPRRP